MHRLSYKSLFIIVVFLLIPIVLLIRLNKHPTTVLAEWWNDSWNYRQVVNISGVGSTTLTDFQVSYSIGTSALITNGKMKSDCSDIRITDQNGTLLPYWIEENNPGCNSATPTKIWTKLSSLSVSGVNIYLYYGNQSATSIQNGNKVFDFFDDFNTNSVDATKWSTVRTGTMTFNNGIVRFYCPSGNYSGLSRYFTAFSSTTLEFRAKPVVLSGQGRFAVFPGDTGQYYDASSYWAWAAVYGIRYYGTYNADWHTFRYSHNGSQVFDYLDGTLGSGFPQNYSNTINYFSIGNTDENYKAADVYFDWIFLRKFAASNPITSNQSEEVGGGPVAYWKFDEGVGTTVYDSTASRNNGVFGPGSSSPTWVTEDQRVSGS